MRDRGFIYKGKYDGLYCTVDEVFVPETQLVDGRCPTCGSSVESVSEESYFFKLSAFQQPLLDHYRNVPDFVTPSVRRNEMVSFLEAGLGDLSISRTSFTWGIPVPDDPAHVMYVWFDALTNYMTAVGFILQWPSISVRMSRLVALSSTTNTRRSRRETVRLRYGSDPGIRCRVTSTVK